MVELKTFFGLLYLQTSLKSNFSLADVILGHGSLYKKDGDALRDSYVDKKKILEKNIVVLSTMHSSVCVTKDKRTKSHHHTFYDHTKRDADVVYLYLFINLHSSNLPNGR